MTISNGEQERKKAIIDRIQQILDNAKHIDSIAINVSASRCEATLIQYNVQEFIIPENSDE